jgi:DNA polymerase III gamma/tau subunit
MFYLFLILYKSTYQSIIKMSATNSPVFDPNMDSTIVTEQSTQDNNPVVSQNPPKITKKQEKENERAAKKQAKEDAKKAKEDAKKAKEDAKKAKEDEKAAKKQAKEDAKKAKEDAKKAKEDAKKAKEDEKAAKKLARENKKKKTEVPTEVSQEVPTEVSQEVPTEVSQEVSNDQIKSLPPKSLKLIEFSYFLIRHFEKSIPSLPIDSLFQLAHTFHSPSSQSSFLQNFFDNHKLIHADLSRIKKSSNSDLTSRIVHNALSFDSNDLPIHTHPFSFNDQHFLIDKLNNLYHLTLHTHIGLWNPNNSSISLF